MQIINKTCNTIYLSDIDLYIPFTENNPIEISLDNAKKSRIFRQMVISKKLFISSCGSSLFEKNLLKLQDKDLPIKKQVQQEFPEPTGELEVRVSGHFYESSGYAKANRNLVFGLAYHKVKVGIAPEIPVGTLLTEITAKKLSVLRKPVSKKAIQIDSAIPTFGKKKENCSYNIILTTIESITIPDIFVEKLNYYDEIWVPSNFCKEVLSKRIDKPIFVLPNSIDINLYKESVAPYTFNPPLNKFVFFSVFGWNYRKGYDILLRSYLEEFDYRDDVTLLLMTRQATQLSSKNRKIKNEVQSYIGKYCPTGSPHIMMYNSLLPEYKMPSLYRACDAFVLFTRGEGFGYPYCEASLCGLPVIGTNCSGQSMFLNKDNCCLLEPDQYVKLSKGNTNIHYWDGEEMADLTSDRFIKDTKAAMRDVYENKYKYKERNHLLRSKIINEYNIKTVSKIAKERLEVIWSKL